MSIDHEGKENDNVRAVWRDFYQSLYPKKSSFELSPLYRNRFLQLADLRQWKKERDRIHLLLFFIFFLIGLVVLGTAFQAEVKFSNFLLLKLKAKNEDLLLILFN